MLESIDDIKYSMLIAMNSKGNSLWSVIFRENRMNRNKIGLSNGKKADVDLSIFSCCYDL
ncbi:MAG TPA: hypothetical protein PLE30_00360 [Candidatus Kapabacteria bacterium]|nr:hypothetical protein [Candidatus Kapabacteria bacterium]